MKSELKMGLRWMERKGWNALFQQPPPILLKQNYRIFPAIILFRPVMVSPRICSLPTADFAGLRNSNAMGYMCTMGTKSQTNTGLSL